MPRAATRPPSPAHRQRRERAVRTAEIGELARAPGAAGAGFEPAPALPRRPPSAALRRQVRRLEREHEARADPSIPPPPPAATDHDR